jgi:hypothetical protein
MKIWPKTYSKFQIKIFRSCKNWHQNTTRQLVKLPKDLKKQTAISKQLKSTSYPKKSRLDPDWLITSKVPLPWNKTWTKPSFRKRKSRRFCHKICLVLFCKILILSNLKISPRWTVKLILTKNVCKLKLRRNVDNSLVVSWHKLLICLSN